MRSSSDVVVEVEVDVEQEACQRGTKMGGNGVRSDANESCREEAGVERLLEGCLGRPVEEVESTGRAKAKAKAMSRCGRGLVHDGRGALFDAWGGSLQILVDSEPSDTHKTHSQQRRWPLVRAGLIADAPLELAWATVMRPPWSPPPDASTPCLRPAFALTKAFSSPLHSALVDTC